MSHQKSTVIIALGGNALSPKKEAGTIEQQFKHTRDSLHAVLHFVHAKYNICITHGNGPQVGAELSRNEIASKSVPPLPLGVLVANTQGAMGYMIQQSLQNALYNFDSDREQYPLYSLDRTLPSAVGRPVEDHAWCIYGLRLVWGRFKGDFP